MKRILFILALTLLPAMFITSCIESENYETQPANVFTIVNPTDYSLIFSIASYPGILPSATNASSFSNYALNPHDSTIVKDAHISNYRAQDTLDIYFYDSSELEYTYILESSSYSLNLDPSGKAFLKEYSLTADRIVSEGGHMIFSL